MSLHCHFPSVSAPNRISRVRRLPYDVNMHCNIEEVADDTSGAIDYTVPAIFKTTFNLLTLILSPKYAILSIALLKYHRYQS